jgi:hypothetical protein
MILKMPRYVFIPRLPTKEAYDNKAFNDYNCHNTLYKALLKRDFGENMKGYIYFKEGIKSQYRDGTEGKSYDKRKWWELGYTSCWDGCCTSPPNKKLIDWKVEDGQEALSLIVKEHTELCEKLYQRHLDDPKPMPKFKPQPIPINREWQEFKRISGPGGFIEQFELIKDKSTIKSLWFSEYGHFRIE